MATTKERLAAIGGFEALASHYVDDYELGRRIANQGYRVEFARTPVELVYPNEGVSRFLRHQLRWKIGLRNVRPSGHAALAMTFGLPWTIAAAFAARSAAAAASYVFAYLTLRFAVYLTVGVWGLQDASVRRTWWLAPVRDAADFAVWVVSFFSNRISWRGREFLVEKGLLIPLDEPRAQSVEVVSNFALAGSTRGGNGGNGDSSFDEMPEFPESVLRFAAREGDALQLGASDDYDR
jgi:ceramide glucosyltransferase